MTNPRQVETPTAEGGTWVELWPAATQRNARLRNVAGAATILRYLDNQGRPDHQTEACDTHASELSATGLKSSAELKVIDRRRGAYGES